MSDESDYKIQSWYLNEPNGLESLTDPGADRLMGWDNSDGAVEWFTPNTGLAISGNNLDVSLAPFDTGDLSEGTNLYYTNARADARIAAANLEDLNDVAAYSSLGDGELLQYKSATSSWTHQTLAEAGIASSSHGVTTNYLPYADSATSWANSPMQTDGTNVGLGVTPESWHGSVTVLQIGDQTAIWNNDNIGAYMTSNAYYDGSWKYIEADHAAAYDQGAGEHQFRVAGSGSADGAISWTTALTIDNSGDVVIGGTTTRGDLRIVRDGVASVYADGYGSHGYFYGERAGGTQASPSAVSSGDTLAIFGAQGWDGNSWETSAKIQMEVDAAVADGQVPGRMLFVTANSSGTLTEAVRIDSSQDTTFKGAVTLDDRLIFSNKTSGGAGGADAANATEIDVSDTSYVTIAPDNGANQDYYKFTNGTDGQILHVVSTTGTTPGADYPVVELHDGWYSVYYPDHFTLFYSSDLGGWTVEDGG